MTSPPSLPESLLFTHEAMHTTFSLRLCGMDEKSAAGVARECYERLDLLENRLSRFAEGGDIMRINHMAAGDTLYVSEDCHQCLLLALEAYSLTDGLFDITLGARIQHQKTRSDGPPPPLTGRLIVHPDIAAITCVEPGREIDLGGIGKGFALDQLKLLLLDWEVPGAMLAAGASSLLAFGPDEWPVDLADDAASLRISLWDESLSASGIVIQGCHIIHPAGPDAMPPHPPTRVWVTAATAALAEIWSTTLMLINPEEIPAFIDGNSGITSVHAACGGEVRKVFPI